MDLLQKLLMAMGGSGDPYLNGILAANPLFFLDSDLGLVFTDAGITPAVNNNDNVAQWNDRGSSLSNMSAGTAAKLQTAVAAYNNKKVVLFTAASLQYLFKAMAGIAANRTTYNIIVVANGINSASAKALYTENSTGSNTPFIMLRTRLTNEGEVNFAHRSDSGVVSSIVSAGGLINNSSPHIITARRISAASFDLRCDGVSVGTASNNPGATTVNQVVVGGSYISGAFTQFMNGQIAAIIITPTDSYAAIEPLLAVKYGVTLP